MSRLVAALLLISTGGLAEHSFDALQRRALWPDAEGALVFHDDAIEFRKFNGKEGHRWRYSEIQSFDRISPTELEVVTYEDAKWRLGQDRAYRFTLRSGKIDDQLFESLANKIDLPVTDRLADDAPDDAPSLSVKHLKPFGGSEGELVFGASAIFYVTESPKQAREWRLDRDVESVWAANRYQLEVHVFEAGRHDFDDTRVYRFQLKEPLDPDFYRNLKLRLYDLRAEDRVIP